MVERSALKFSDLFDILVRLWDAMYEHVSAFVSFLNMPFIDVLNLPIDALPNGLITNLVQDVANRLASFLTAGFTDLPFYQVIFGQGLLFLMCFFVVKGILDIVL